MSRIHEAARNFLQQYSSLSAFAQAIIDEGWNEENKNNLVAEIKGHEATLAALKSDHDAVTTVVAGQRSRLAEIDAEIAKKLDHAADQAQAVIYEAEKVGETIIEKAKMRALELKTEADTAQGEAMQQVAILNGEIASFIAEKQHIEEEIAALKQKFA